MTPEEIQDQSTPEGAMAYIILEKFHWAKMKDGADEKVTPLARCKELRGDGIWLKDAPEIIEAAKRLGLTETIQQIIKDAASLVIQP